MLIPLAALNALLLIVNLAGESGQQPGLQLLGLALAALSLDLFCVEFMALGTFSSSGAPLLAVALLGHPGLAAVTGAVGAALRIRLPGQRAGHFMTGLLMELASLSLACSVSQLPRWLTLPAWAVPWSSLLVTATFLGAFEALSRKFSRSLPPPARPLFRRLLRVLFRLRLALGLAALFLAGSVGLGWQQLLIVPLLLTTHLAADSAMFRLQAQQANAALSSFEEARRRLAQARLEVQEARFELNSTQSERSRMESFSERLQEQPDLQQAGAYLLETVRRTAASPTAQVAILLGQGSSLAPLATSPLQGLRQSLVSQSQLAWQSGSPQLHQSGEESTLALLMGDRGVLAISRLGAPWSTEEFRFFLWMGQRSALTFEHLQQKLDHQAARLEATELASQIGGLSALLDAARLLGSTLEVERLVPAAAAALKELIGVPHTGGIVVRNCTCWWGEKTSWDRVQSKVQQVQQSATPILEKTPHWLTMLVPILSEESCLGVLVALLPAGLAVDLQDKICLLASTLGLSLSNAAHYSESVQARKDLQQSQAQIVQVGRQAASGQLGAGVAHELNSPLGAIVLCAESILRDAVTPKVEGKARRIHEAALHCRGIVNKLLFYTRHSGEKLAVFSLNGLLDDALQFASGWLQEAGIEVERQPLQQVSVEGNEGDLLQVILNLLRNAADSCLASGSDQKQIWVGCHSEGGTGRLLIADNGEGMANQEVIFDPFYSTRDLGQRLGLGLTVAQQIVGRHRGTIEVRAREGGGSLFTVALPLASSSGQR